MAHATKTDAGVDGDAGAHDDAGVGVVLVVAPRADGLDVPTVAVQLITHNWKKQQAFQVGEIPYEASCKQPPSQKACALELGNLGGPLGLQLVSLTL